jgi:hypothetical protein
MSATSLAPSSPAVQPANNHILQPITCNYSALQWRLSFGGNSCLQFGWQQSRALKLGIECGREGRYTKACIQIKSKINLGCFITQHPAQTGAWRLTTVKTMAWAACQANQKHIMIMSMPTLQHDVKLVQTMPCILPASPW